MNIFEQFIYRHQVRFHEGSFNILIIFRIKPSFTDPLNFFLKRQRTDSKSSQKAIVFEGLSFAGNQNMSFSGFMI